MTATADTLRQKHCVPCEGGIPALSEAEARKSLKLVPAWSLSPDRKRIWREWQVKDFAAGMEFLQKVGKSAEEEGHHPDLHLVDFRQVRIELSTHAVKGLSENDFILAAKIDELPVSLKTR